MPCSGILTLYTQPVCQITIVNFFSAGNFKYFTYHTTFLYILTRPVIRKLIDFIFTDLSQFEHTLYQNNSISKCKTSLTNIQNVFKLQADFILDKVRVRITHIACFILLVIFVLKPEWNLILLNVPPIFMMKSPLLQV